MHAEDELPADFFDDQPGRAADGLDAKEEKSQGSAPPIRKPTKTIGMSTRMPDGQICMGRRHAWRLDVG